MHSHDWNLVDKTLIESPLSKLLNSGRAITNFKSSNAAMMDRVVLVFKCDCGKIRIEER